MIVARGTITIEKLKELCLKHLDIKSDSDIYNPHINKNAISLIKQEDGNWKGWGTCNDAVIEVREQMPDHALARILTHK